MNKIDTLILQLEKAEITKDILTIIRVLQPFS